MSKAQTHWRCRQTTRSALARTGEAGRQAGNSLDVVEAVLAELLHEVHEVALDERDLVLEAGLDGVLVRTVDLERVVVYSNDVGVGEARNLASGASDSAPNVEDAGLGLDAARRREVVLVWTARSAPGREMKGG